jgi:putative membrane protein
VRALRTAKPDLEDAGMTWGIIVAWFHYASLMLLIAAVLGEMVVLKPQITVAEARILQRLDTTYGASATLLLATGVARMFLEKGVAYYLHHVAFHILVALFVVIGLLSIYPTVVFLRWRAEIKADRAPAIPPEQFGRLKLILRMEIGLLLIAPLFAAWMAHGTI